MMPRMKLEKALSSVDWTANVGVFLGLHDIPDIVAQSTVCLAIWSKQIEIADNGNPALAYVRAMQVCAQQTAALLALALYRPGASCMRAIIENALYYSYFRTHPAELRTIARTPTFYLQRKDFIDYHKLHTPDFAKMQGVFDLTNRLNNWYALVSSIVHGQLPNRWVKHTALAGTAHDEGTLQSAVETFVEGIDLVHAFFLCTIAQDLWSDFHIAAKRALLKGLTPSNKAVLSLATL